MIRMIINNKKMKITQSHLKRLIKEELQKVLLEAEYDTKVAMDMAYLNCDNATAGEFCGDFFNKERADHWVDLRDDPKEIERIGLSFQKRGLSAGMVDHLMKILTVIKCIRAGSDQNETVQREIKTIVSVIRDIMGVDGEIQCPPSDTEEPEELDHEERAQRYRDIGYGRPSRD